MRLFAGVSLISFIGIAFGGNDINVISSAIVQMAKEHFVKVSNNLRIVKYCGNSTEIESIANGILKKSKNISLTFEVIDLKKSELQGFALNQSAILLFNDLGSLLQFYNSMKFKTTNSDTLNVFTYYEFKGDVTWSFGGQSSIYYNVAILTNQGDHLTLTTHLVFNPGACRKIINTEINQFSKAEMKWKNGNFFLEKYENLNGCRVTIALPYQNDLSILVTHPNGSVTASGINIKLMEILAKRMNFSMTYLDLQTKLPRNFNMINYAINNLQHIIRKFVISYVYDFDSLQFFVPPGDFYTPAEKLLLPFDMETWICFVAVFAVALLVTFLLLVSRDSLKEYFFGSNVKTPTMNLFQHFFGFGQTVLPRRNFARFILMMFILFCLIMRNAYQGKMFEFLTSDVRKKAATTIEETIERGMTLYAQESLAALDEDDILKRLKKQIYYEKDMDELFYKVIDPDVKGMVIMTRSAGLMMKLHLEENFTLKALNEELYATNTGVAFDNFHFLQKPFNDMIPRIFESGMIDYWRFLLHPADYFSWKPQKSKDPVMLTWEHVYIGFYIWLIFLALSISCFLLEVFNHQMSQITFRFRFH